MQKVVGSSPISRLKKPATAGSSRSAANLRVRSRLWARQGGPSFPGMKRSLITALAAAALLAVAVAPVVHGATSKACGLTPRIDGVRYDVRETRGTVACKTVKRVVTRFLRSGTAKAPWTCAFNHGSSPFAASCARGKSVLVRVYAPG
jgi:hypothetical protein